MADQLLSKMEGTTLEDNSTENSFEDDVSDSIDLQLSHFRTFFEVIKPLGGGGFGAVWLCEHTLTKQQYAVKRIILRESRLDRICREAEILSKLKHPNVVSYNHCWHEPCTEEDKAENKVVQEFEFEEDSSDQEEEPFLSFYICMQYCSSTLKEQIKCNRELDLYGIAVQVADGLCYIHKSNVIHGDLSSLNILMDGDTPKIADFGLAVLLNDRAAGVYTSSIGNPLYLAPELRVESPRLTCMSDIYSLGLIFFELFFAHMIVTDLERFKLIETFKKDNKFPERKVHEDVMSLIEKMTLDEPNARMNIEDVGLEIQRLHCDA